MGQFEYERSTAYTMGSIVSGRDLDDAMAKRAAYEAQMAEVSSRANSNREPVVFLSPVSSPHR